MQSGLFKKDFILRLLRYSPSHEPNTMRQKNAWVEFKGTLTRNLSKITEYFFSVFFFCQQRYFQCQQRILFDSQMFQKFLTTVKKNRTDKFCKSTTEFAHLLIHLTFFFARSTKNFAKKYDLELTAATFLIIDYNESSMDIACEWQKCIGDTINLVSPLRCGSG